MMSNDLGGLLAARPEASERPRVAAGRLRGLELGPTGVAVSAVVAAAAVLLYVHHFEGGNTNQMFVVSATLLVAGLIVLATRRPLVAVVLVPAMVGIIVGSGDIKYRHLEMNLHAYDVVFYLTSGPTLSFLWSEYRNLVALLFFAITGITLLTLMAYRLDATRIARSHALAACLALAAMTAYTSAVKGERGHTQQYWDDLTLSTFYSSLADAAETLWQGQLIEAAASGNGAPFALPTSCSPARKPPHIILLHQESVVPPEIVPGVSYDTSLDPMFRSFDGELHPMRVETYGGASWLTEFSILTGVSTFSFGGMRTFVHSLMSGRIRDTLPQTLKRCGYRNVVFFPGDRNFVSYAKFYTAAGMGEIRDSRDMKASRLNERDRFFYDASMAEMQRHFASSRQPLFTYVLTMATHGPYDRAYMPEVAVRGGGPGTNPEMNEYLRRLAMAKIDLDYFMAELARRFPAESFLVVHYGDHHPVATRSYLGFASIDSPQDVPLKQDSVGYLTYYSVRGINYTPPALPDVDVLDVPYLGLTVLEAAGLPLSEAYRERRRLLVHCQGRYYGCKDRDQILAFHRRLIDSGLIESR